MSANPFLFDRKLLIIDKIVVIGRILQNCKFIWFTYQIKNNSYSHSVTYAFLFYDLIWKGKTLNLTIKGKGGKATFTSRNKKVATVTTSGKVTAKGAGIATVTMKMGAKTYTVRVRVNKWKEN